MHVLSGAYRSDGAWKNQSAGAKIWEDPEKSFEKSKVPIRPTVGIISRGFSVSRHQIPSSQSVKMSKSTAVAKASDAVVSPVDPDQVCPCQNVVGVKTIGG